MPRKKLIDEDYIRFEKIDKDIIEKKNCLGVKLVFTTPMGQRQLHTMRTFYKITTDETGLTADRRIKNSWKGVVMLLLSLVYCRYGTKFFKMNFDTQASGKKYRHHLHIDFAYQYLLQKDVHDNLRNKARREASAKLYSIEKYYQLDEDGRKKLKDEIQKQAERNFRKLLQELPPDPTFEEIPMPPSWKPFYVRGDYIPPEIEGSIMVLAKLLDLDPKNSIVTTEYYEKVPHSYAVFPAKYRDTTDLLCSCFGDFNFSYGVEIVTETEFSLLLSSNYAQRVDIKMPPDQIVIGTTPIYGYNITPSTVEQISTYFPFMESEFYAALTTMGGSAWVIFDGKHLGKWG